jgi:hypothetical protein
MACFLTTPVCESGGVTPPVADMYNVATIQKGSYGADGDGFDYSNSPQITVSSPRTPDSGSTMTLMSHSDVTNSPYPLTNAIWYLNQIE